MENGQPTVDANALTLLNVVLEGERHLLEIAGTALDRACESNGDLIDAVNVLKRALQGDRSPEIFTELSEIDAAARRRRKQVSEMRAVVTAVSAQHDQLLTLAQGCSHG
jgi:hypothetical protein